MVDLNNQTPDIELINAYRTGDNEAITVLLERYNSRIYNYIKMLVKDRYVADDIYQDLFIKISESLKSQKYTDNGKFINWAMRIAHNKVIDHFRVLNNKRELSTDDDGREAIVDRIPSDESVDGKIIKEQMEADIKRLVDSLPVEQREVVVMRHYLGLSFKEIADLTGVSINTALGRMRYALINLRKMMEGSVYPAFMS